MADRSRPLARAASVERVSSGQPQDRGDYVTERAGLEAEPHAGATPEPYQVPA